MNNSPRTEPIAMVVSMALTALAATYVDATDLTVDATDLTWRTIVGSLIFVLAGTSTTQLYWSLIIPLLRDQLDIPLTRGGKTKYKFLGRLASFYFRGGARFLIARCTVKEMRLLGYLNGLAAFIVFFLAQFLHMVELGVGVKLETILFN